MDYLLAQLLTNQESSGHIGFGFLAADFFGNVQSFLKILTVVLFLAIVFVLYKFSQLHTHARPTQYIAESLRGSVVSTSRLAKQWAKIRERLAQPTEAEWKISVIEADNLVDDVLRRMGYPGTSMGERLKNITQAQVTTLDAIWAGHRVRNKIVHDPEGRLLHREARDTIANFEAFLNEANVFEKIPGAPPTVY